MNGQLERIRQDSATVRMVQIQPYTMVEVSWRGESGYGFAKCNPRDAWSAELGRTIAIGRAQKAIANRLHKEGTIHQELFGPSTVC